MAASMTVQGARELERKLTSLGPKLGKKVLKKALRTGAKIVKKATQAAAPKKSGTMRRAIITRALKRNRPGRFALIQLFNTRKYPQLIKTSRGGNRAFYPASVEYGHAGPNRGAWRGETARPKGRTGKATGRKVAKPTRFIQRGFRSSEARAERAIIRDIKIGIEAEWSKRA